MSLSNKTIAGSYKDLLHLNNNGSGVSATNTHVIKDGNGTNTSLQVGKRGTLIKGHVDTVSTFQVANTPNDSVLKVDTSSKLVRVNETQAVANTQYLRFAQKSIDVDSSTHIGVSLSGNPSGSAVTFGTSANPAAPSINNNGDDWIHYLHYVDTNIEVDAVTVLVGATAATGDSINFHLCNLATGDSTTVDEWSGTTIVADQSSVTVNAGYEQFYKVALDVQSASVDAGNYLALTIVGSGTNSDYSVNALVRYHLR